MGKRDVFHNDGDPHRLHILPSGHREFCGSDGDWSAQVEREVVFSSLADNVTTLSALGVATTAKQALTQLEQIARIRSQLDSAEALLLADALELANREAEQNAEQQVLFQDALQERSAEYYGVDPRNPDIIRSSLVSEVSIAMREPERVVRGKLITAEGLRHLCPRTLSELSQGSITTKSAVEIVKNSQDLEPEEAHHLEEVLLPIARTSPDHTVKKQAQKMRGRLHPQSPEERHKVKQAERGVICWNEDGGMAKILITLEAQDALAIMNTLNWHIAGHRDPDDDRGDAQIRADIFRDVLLDGWPERKGADVKARIAITIPALEMLANPQRTVAELEGYGPVPLGVALQLAKNAPSLIPVLTDPWTGAVIDIGRTRYRPPNVLREFLRWRDEHCCFPGCRRLPDASEIDHIDDWAKGGGTTRRNTRLLCKRHQMFKHALGWQSAYRPDGSVEWRTPNGMIQTHLPGSIRSAQSFEPEMATNPMLPTVEVNDEVLRVLGWRDPPQQNAG